MFLRTCLPFSALLAGSLTHGGTALGACAQEVYEAFIGEGRDGFYVRKGKKVVYHYDSGETISDVSGQMTHIDQPLKNELFSRVRGQTDAIRLKKVFLFYLEHFPHPTQEGRFDKSEVGKIVAWVREETAAFSEVQPAGMERREWRLEVHRRQDHLRDVENGFPHLWHLQKVGVGAALSTMRERRINPGKLIDTLIQATEAYWEAHPK